MNYTESTVVFKKNQDFNAEQLKKSKKYQKVVENGPVQSPSPL